MPKLHRIRLTSEESQQLESLRRKGSIRADWHRAATVLLMADENRSDGPLRDSEIARAIHAHVRTVERIRERAVMDGFDAVLTRKPHPNPKPRKLDGKAEASLVALCCSQPPDGRTCWTMQLLADKIVELQIVDSIGLECVRRTLKKRSPAMVPHSVVHPAKGKPRVCLCDGGRDRSLSPAAGSETADGLFGRTGAKRR